MSFCLLRCQRAFMVALVVPLFLSLLSPFIVADEKVSKYLFEEEPTVKLGRWAGELHVGPGMNVVGNHLHGSEFVAQDLTGAVLDGCDLYGVRFIECDLSQASFKNACLTGATIEGCGLDEANFSDAIVNGLRLASSYLSEEQLVSTLSYKTKDLRNCAISAHNKGEHETLVSYDFQNANMSGAALVNGDFSGCDFTDAAIGDIALFTSKITAKQLASTSDYKRHKLRHMRFWNFQTLTRGPCAIDGRVDFSGVDLTRTHFRGRPLDADFSGAIISECHFDYTITKGQLCLTKNYREGNLARIKLLGIDLSGCDLSRQNLTDCAFAQCNFSGAKFDDAIITNADFSRRRNAECTGLTLDQIKSTWNYRNKRMEGIVLPKELADALSAEKR